MYPIAVKEPALEVSIEITGGYNATGFFVWWMNNITYYGDYNDPLLLETKLGTTTYAPMRAMYDWGNYSSVRVSLYSVGLPAAHPMHLHGHNFQVLSSGVGTWDGKITNPKNPQRRDTHLLPPLGYSVLQWDLDNPGVWSFHCHIAWHISEGMGLNIMEMPKKVMKETQLPSTMAQTCRDWAAWTGVNVVDQIDSGL